MGISYKPGSTGSVLQAIQNAAASVSGVVLGSGAALYVPSTGRLDLRANNQINFSTLVGGSVAINMTGTLGCTGDINISGNASFTTNASSGAIGIRLNTTGARLKLSTAGTTDYLYSDGATAIKAAGALDVEGVLRARSDTGSGGYVFNSGASGSHYFGVKIAGAPLVELANGATLGMNGFSTPLTIEGDQTSPARAAFRIIPQDAQPTGPNAVGDIYVTTAGVLKICTAAGSPGTWVSVGAQT